MALEELKANNLDIRKLTGISTDGASVTTGLKCSGVKLLREYSPSLVGIHCVAHRTSLDTSQTAKVIKDTDECSNVVSSGFATLVILHFD